MRPKHVFADDERNIYGVTFDGDPLWYKNANRNGTPSGAKGSGTRVGSNWQAIRLAWGDLRSAFRWLLTLIGALALLIPFAAKAEGEWTKEGAVIRLSDDNDRVGIGTAAPAAKLSIVDNSPDFAGLSIERSGVVATSGKGYSFRVGEKLPGGQGPGGVLLGPRLHMHFLISEGGNVGIGSESPSHRLSISRGPTWTANGWGGSIELTNGSAIGWQANGAGHRFGIGHTDGGLYFFRTNSDPATTSAPATYDLEINDAGNVIVNVLEIKGGADIAENFDVREAKAPSRDASLAEAQPGQVVSIDPETPGKLTISNSAYDRRVAGIISGAGGVKPGMLMGQMGSVADGGHPVALIGRTYCWADASHGSIEPGDLLTTSSTPGHAMKVTDHAKAQGAIIGKAMTGLKEGKALVLVLVTLQ